MPPTPANLPAAVEQPASYVPASSCDPRAKVGTTKLGNLLKATYPGSSYGIDRTCGTDPLPTSEHYDGRAVDWFVNVRTAEGKARADAAIGWMLRKDAQGNDFANARRLGVMYVIWNNRIWASYRSAEGWRPYSDCAKATAKSADTRCHRDHVHISLSWEGAKARTSYWTGKVATRDFGPCRTADLNWAAPYVKQQATPCPSFPKVNPPAGASSLLKTLTTYSGMTQKRGDTGPVVRAVQQAVGTTVDGTFGSVTQAAVKSWQQGHGVSSTGVVDAPTWRTLLAAHAPKPAAEPAAKPTPKPAAKPAVTHPELTRYKQQKLSYGSRGNAVVALQRRLGVTPRSGWFGPKTRTAVKTFQRNRHLSVTGVVTASTWKALGA